MCKNCGGTWEFECSPLGASCRQRQNPSGQHWTYRILSARWIRKVAIHFDLLFECPPTAQGQRYSAAMFTCSPFIFQLLWTQPKGIQTRSMHTYTEYSIVIFYATTQITVNRMGFLVHCILLHSDIFKLFQLVPTYTLFIHSFDLNYVAIWHELSTVPLF